MICFKMPPRHDDDCPTKKKDPKTCKYCEKMREIRQLERRRNQQWGPYD